MPLYIRDRVAVLHFLTNPLIQHDQNPDSMTTLGQRWQTVGPLADSWRWVHNVGPTLRQQ